MAKGDSFWRQQARKDHAQQAERDGRVADNMEIRMELVRRLEAGEITFEQMQAELETIKRNAKQTGKITRAQAWRGH